MAASRSARLPSTENSGVAPLTPQLKDFIDCAIVPVLVKRYLAECEQILAYDAPDAGHSIRSPKATPDREQDERR